MFPFHVELNSCFHTYELYDSEGRQIFNLQDAIDVANKQFGDSWVSVFNGQIARENE